MSLGLCPSIEVLKTLLEMAQLSVNDKRLGRDLKRFREHKHSGLLRGSPGVRRLAVADLVKS